MRRIDLDFEDALWNVLDVCTIILAVVTTVFIIVVIGFFIFAFVTSIAEYEPVTIDEAATEETDIYETEVFEDGIHE